MASMPYSRKWQKLLAAFYDAPTASRFVSKAQAIYEQFSAQHSTDKNPRNRTALVTRILPGLSIYKVLREENFNQEKVLHEVETLFRSTFFTRSVEGIRLLNYLPNPFWIVRSVLKWMTSSEYLSGSQEIIADTSDCFAIDIHRCYILDILTLHDAQELTALYCKTDDWLAEALPGIRWQRTKTLGRGDDCCDFRWYRDKK
jgi:hypothetical protein